MPKIFDSLYPEYNGELAQVLISDDPRVYGKGDLLDQFIHNDMPRIAISVDMLDTGIDVREIVNLVFAKPVYSYTKFWQMIGRGTRLLEENKIKPWCPEKDMFLIIDCWDNFEYFKLTPEGKEVIQQIPLPVRFVGIRLNKIKKAMDNSKYEIAEFDQFIQEHSNFTARQLDFLNLLREYIIEREKIQKQDLIQSPFTIIHPQGIWGLFSPFKIDEI